MLPHLGNHTEPEISPSLLNSFQQNKAVLRLFLLSLNKTVLRLLILSLLLFLCVVLITNLLTHNLVPRLGNQIDPEKQSFVSEFLWNKSVLRLFLLLSTPSLFYVYVFFFTTTFLALLESASYTLRASPASYILRASPASYTLYLVFNRFHKVFFFCATLASTLLSTSRVSFSSLCVAFQQSHKVLQYCFLPSCLLSRFSRNHNKQSINFVWCPCTLVLDCALSSPTSWCLPSRFLDLLDQETWITSCNLATTFGSWYHIGFSQVPEILYSQDHVAQDWQENDSLY